MIIEVIEYNQSKLASHFRRLWSWKKVQLFYFSGGTTVFYRCSTSGKRKNKSETKKWSDFSLIWLYHRPLLPWTPNAPPKNSQHGFNTLLLSRFTRSWPGCMAANSLHTVPRSDSDEGDFKAPRLNWTKSPCKMYVWFLILRQKCFDNSPISTVQQPVGIEIRRPSFEDLGIFTWLAMRRWHNECWLHPNWWHGIASAHVARTVCKLFWGKIRGAYVGVYVSTIDVLRLGQTTKTYCWWKKSCISWAWQFIPSFAGFYASQVVSQISEPSTVWVWGSQRFGSSGDRTVEILHQVDCKIWN